MNEIIIDLHFQANQKQMRAIKDFQEDYLQTFTPEEAFGSLINIYMVQHLDEVIQYVSRRMDENK